MAARRKQVAKDSIWPTEPVPGNRDLVRLLLSTKEFHADIREARGNIGILTVGAKCTQEEFERAINALQEKSMELAESDAYFEEGRAIQRRFLNGEIDAKGKRELLRAHADKLWWHHFDHMAEFLCWKYNLPYSFEWHIGNYLLWGKGNNLSYPSENFTITYDRSGDVRSYKNAKNVVLHVYAPSGFF